MFSKKLFAVVFIHFISLGDCRCPRRNPCEPSPCDANATCNIMGKSFTCECNEGYSGDGFNCEAIIVDECDVEINDCGCKEICIARPEGNTCECEDGYSSEGTSPCQPTDPPLFYNLCDAGEVCYAEGTCCTGVPEPGNPCTSDAECPSDFCHFGRCRCNADGNSAFHVDTSGQCVTSCQTYGTTFSFYPQRVVYGGWYLIASFSNKETCFSECLKNDACNMVQFVDYVCEPESCKIFTINSDANMGYYSRHDHIYIRNCA